MECRYQVSSEKFISDINNANELKRENINKIMTNIHSLINKQFKLNPAFDHKGSKNFLNSKKIALQQIILDDDESIDFEPKNETNKNLKNSNKNIGGKSLKEEEKNIINYTNANNSFKKKKEEKKIIKEYFTNIYKSSTNNRKYFSNKKTNKKLHHKFYSNHELKMFKDKEIKKIKSIKKDKNKSKKSNNANINISFIEKNDSSIFDIIAQLK